jgi:hypothetical protein
MLSIIASRVQELIYPIQSIYPSLILYNCFVSTEYSYFEIYI